MTEQRMTRHPDGPEGTYSREITCVLTGVSAVRLARYERAQIVVPLRQGRQCFYRAEDIKRIRKAHRLEGDLGINLPGVEVILRLAEQLEALQRRLVAYEAPADESRRDEHRRPRRTQRNPERRFVLPP